MKSSALKYVFLLSMFVPLLGGCWDDDDDDPVRSAPPVTDGGGQEGGDGGDGGDGGEEPNPNSLSSFFSAPSEGEPLEIDDAEALSADIEATFGAPSDDAREPGEVLDLSGEA